MNTSLKKLWQDQVKMGSTRKVGRSDWSTRHLASAVSRPMLPPRRLLNISRVGSMCAWAHGLMGSPEVVARQPSDDTAFEELSKSPMERFQKHLSLAILHEKDSYITEESDLLWTHAGVHECVWWCHITDVDIVLSISNLVFIFDVISSGSCRRTPIAMRCWSWLSRWNWCNCLGVPGVWSCLHFPEKHNLSLQASYLIMYIAFFLFSGTVSHM